MLAQDTDNTPVNDSMEVCPGCSWELALWLGRSQAFEEAERIARGMTYGDLIAPAAHRQGNAIADAIRAAAIQKEDEH